MLFTMIEDLAVYFQDLYKDDKNDLSGIRDLKTDLYIPELDDPITKEEMESALNIMKKGGYDHRLDFFKIIVRFMSPLILILMNIMFYITYPANLAISLLIAIPKKGNLSLPKNFRGIQMLQALAALYDRVITVRLEKWIKICYEQSAF